MRLHVIIQILKNRQCVCVCSSCVSADVSTCCNCVFVSTDSHRHMDPWITWTSGCRRRFKIQHLKRFLLKMTTWLKHYFLVGLWVWWHTPELHGSVYCHLQHKTVKWRAAAASSYRDGPNKYITVTQREVVLRPTGKEQTLNYILFEWSFELKMNSCARGCVFMKTWSDTHFSDILMSWYCFSVCDSQRFSVLLLFPLTFWIYVISQNKSGHRDYIHCWGRGSATKYSYFLYNTPLESEHQHLSTSTKRRDKTAPETQRGWEVIKGYIAQ